MDEESEITTFKPDVGEEPPELSIGNIIAAFREKGIMNAINDESMGPHTHLVLLLALVFFLAIIIGIVQLAM